MTATNTTPPVPPTGATVPASPPIRRGAITRLLCWTGGIDPDGRTPSELTRALAGPALLFLTAGLALVSGSIFGADLLHLPQTWAVATGAFFSAFVFFLDRYIILSLDGLHGSRRLLTGLVRLAMAVLLGYVVAEPFVLRIFNTEIAAELASYGQGQLQTESKKIAANPDYGDEALAEAAKLVDLTRARAAATGFDPAAIASDPEVQRLTAELDQVETARRAQQAKVECENDGTCGTGRAGSGPEWERKRSELTRLEQQAADLRAQIASAEDAAAERSASARAADARSGQKDLPGVITALDDAKAARRTALATMEEAIQGQRGLGAKMDALDRLKEARSSIRTEWMLVTALLVVLDTAPVALKLMQRSSVDDEVRELQRKAAVDRERLVAQHQAEELATTLEDDTALAGLVRAAMRQHHEQQLRTFLEQVPAAADDPTSIGNVSLPEQASAQLGQRIGDLRWRGGPSPSAA